MNGNKMYDKKNKRKKGIAGFFTNNILLKILSLIIAVILWSYVLVYTGAEREKTVKDVNVYFEGETVLNSNNFIISGDRDKILSPVTITAKVSVTDAAYVNKDNISAYVDLGRIHKAGTHVLKINPVSDTGAQIVSVEPSTVEVEVDVLSKVSIPVQIKYEGALPEGYWRSEAVSSPVNIEISGPLSEIEQIEQAVCYVPLDGRTEGYVGTTKVVLLDANGVVMDDSNLYDKLPSVILSMEVLPTKEVDIDVTSALKGLDQLKTGYEVRSVIASPDKVTIAAPQDVLDAITSLAIESISLHDSDTYTIASCSVILPYSSIRHVSRSAIEVSVDIAQITTAETLEGIGIDLKGKTKGLNYTLITEKTNITAQGPVALMKKVYRSSFDVFIDVTDLVAGTYQLPIECELPESLVGVAVSLTPSQVTVIIS